MNLNRLLKPHVYVKNINSVNFDAIKNILGIEYVFFDKDDTITNHGVEILH